MAVVQACAQGITTLRIGDAADHAAILALQDAVAARDRGQRADRMQRTRQPAQAQRLVLQVAGEQGLRASAQRLQALAQAFDAAAWMASAQHGIRMAQPCAFLLQPTLHRIGQSQPGLLAASCQRIQSCLRTQRMQAQESAVDALCALAQGIGLLRVQLAMQAMQMRQQVGPVRHQQFRGGRRRGRAQVGGEIGQGEVGLAHRPGLRTRCMLRHGQKVLTANGDGEILSGTFSPSIGKAIAFARVPAGDPGDVRVDIRGKEIPVRVVKFPFVREGKVQDGI